MVSLLPSDSGGRFTSVTRIIEGWNATWGTKAAGGRGTTRPVGPVGDFVIKVGFFVRGTVVLKEWVPDNEYSLGPWTGGMW